MIDYLHEKDEDIDNDVNIPKIEKQYRERLRLTIGELKASEEQGTYWSIDDNLRRLLTYRPTIKEMKLILEPMCYLSISITPFTHGEGSERDRYFVTLQRQLIKEFLDQYRQRMRESAKP